MNAEDPHFEDQAEAQRRAWARLSPLERLRWLQQAKAFTRRYLGAAAGRPAGESSGSSR